MPFYEYQATNSKEACSHCRDYFEVMQSINNKLKKCPECGVDVVRLISRIGGVIMKGRGANEYNDILKAKYWRDHNGVRHKVTGGDGHTGSGTVSKKQTRTPEEVAAIKKRAGQRRKRKRTQESYQRFTNQKRK